MEAPKRRTVVETKTTFEGTNVTLDAYHCVKSVQIRNFFWLVFSPIKTEYGEIRSIYPYSVRMWENTDQKKVCI